MAYITTALGMKLADPNTIQAFETVQVNANFMALENGILADRDRLTSLEGGLDARGYLRYTTKALMTANVSAVVSAHATVYADPTAALNGDYVWSGTAWILVRVPDIAPVKVGSGGSAIAYTAGWSNYTDGVVPWDGLWYSRVSGWTYLTGASAKASWGGLEVICTLPLGMRPERTLQIGPSIMVRVNGDILTSGAGTAALSGSGSWPSVIA